MQHIHSSNPAVVTGICYPNKSGGQHHQNNEVFIEPFLEGSILQSECVV